MEQQEMKTVDVAKLEGQALDWAVAAVLDFKFDAGDIYIKDGMVVTRTGARPWDYWAPSRSWSQCGPLLEKHCIELTIGEDAYFARRTMTNPYESEPVWSGHTMLVAACRAIVGNKLGYLADVPTKFLNQP